MTLSVGLCIHKQCLDFDLLQQHQKFKNHLIQDLFLDIEQIYYNGLDMTLLLTV